MIRKIHLSIVLFLFISILSVTAQNTKGLALDSETKEPIPFVSITVLSGNEQSYIGNTNGAFFIGYGIFSSDTLVFSCIGYESKHISVSEIRKNQMTVYLNPKTISLPEITVSTPQSILKEAWDNISNNYPTEYSLLKSRYRKQMAEDDRLIFIGECEMLTSPFTLKEELKGKEPKLSFSDKKMFEADSVRIHITLNVHPSLYPYNPVINPENYKNYSYIRQPSNEDGIYKIEFSGGMNNNREKGFIYISINDKAILSIHREIKQANEAIKDPLGRTKGEWGDITFVNDYFWEETDLKYQLSYMRCVYTFYLAGNEKAKVMKNTMHKYSVVADYFITERGGESSAKFKKLGDPFKNTKDAIKLNASDFTLIPSDFSK
ncbi:MAG: carboxypeptidase-like regulatory domain-containing protein [Candidatus Symbiothrix sp.]|jgi:hypothetical protein|nr:carboxypeptidase-like regulatory domain-containing protein [Candidatus Symbiothrix sp.]